MADLTARNAPLTLSDAYHLVRRATLHPSRQYAEQFVGKSPAEAVAMLIDAPNDGALPSWADRPPAIGEDFNVLAGRWGELQRWWAERLLSGPSLRERMTLFWMNVFVTDYIAVYFAQHNVTQMRTIRRHALESYRDLSLAMVGDPAMLIYLNGNLSLKGNPNENFAREWFELFSLGVGHYSEDDIQEAARAFTGWAVVGLQGRHYPALADAGSKTILGQTGNWGWQDVIRITLDNSQCARFIATKLWGTFVSANPEEADVDALASIIRDNDYNMGPVLRTLLASEAFYAGDVRGALVKAPVDLITGLAAFFGGTGIERALYVNANGLLDQVLFYPPTVEGWKGHRTWISSTTFPLRQRVGEGFVVSRTADGRNIPLQGGGAYTLDLVAHARTMPGHTNPRELVRSYSTALLAVPITKEQEDVLVEILMTGLEEHYWDINDEAAARPRLRGLLQAIVRMPEFQLM
jgi:hypothetical protein